MSISIPGRVVVVDYGEVISRSPSGADTAALLALAGVPAEQFWEPYWAHRADLDRGRIRVHEYWALLARELGAQWSAARVQELWAADFRGWISVEPGTVQILADLHEGGTRLALLSNAGFDFGDPFRYSPMGAWFERVFVSAELDELKPEASIYRVVAEGLGVELSQMVFVDNKPENVAGAEALGVTGHVFTTPAELRAFLTGLAD
ncbi:MAG: HAD family phosphatase [Micrococcales bacterium]|nr:HAD family phosphatase [Micrococcales bacterium]